MWSIAHNLCKVLNNGLKDTKSHERHSRLLSSVFETSDEERRFFSLQRELFFASFLAQQVRILFSQKEKQND